MDTYSVGPTPEYVQKSVENIPSAIAKSGESLYMIAGVKIARGGEGSNKSSSNFGIDTNAGVDQSAANVPASGDLL